MSYIVLSSAGQNGVFYQHAVDPSAGLYQLSVDGEVVESRAATSDEMTAARDVWLGVAQGEVARIGPGARLLYPTADGFVVFAYRHDPNPRRLFVTRSDRSENLQVCAVLQVPDIIPLKQTASVVGWAISQVEALRLLPELSWADLPDEIVADILVATTDPLDVIAQVQAALNG